MHSLYVSLEFISAQLAWSVEYTDCISTEG